MEDKRLRVSDILNEAAVAIENPRPVEKPLRFSHRAMATEFEIFIFDEDSNDAEQACGAVFEEIDRLEQQLSYFIPWGDVSQINRLRAGQAVRVGAVTLECISLARRIHDHTDRAFDPTVGALLRERRPWDENEDFPVGGSIPPERNGPVSVGMDLVEINSELQTVGKLVDGVAVDLGGIGKGYALDQARIVLQDWGIDRVVVQAGQSTIYPIGLPSHMQGWPMRLLNPRGEQDVLGRFYVNAMVVSASSAEGSTHILDPKSGEPVHRWLGAWSVAPSAVEADALSTAFMVMEAHEVEKFCQGHADISAILVKDGSGIPNVLKFGDWDRFGFELIA
jgi:thiamine biosynthesis lipoprotein